MPSFGVAVGLDPSRERPGRVLPGEPGTVDDLGLQVPFCAPSDAPSMQLPHASAKGTPPPHHDRAASRTVAKPNLAQPYASNPGNLGLQH